MKHSQHNPSASSSAGINYGLNLTRGLYLKQSWKQKAYRLMLGVLTLAFTVSLIVAFIMSLLIISYTGV